MRIGRRELARSWSRILAEAEKLVNYSGSFLSLRVLLSEEVADVAVTARKLIGTKHPLLSTARELLRNGNNAIQTRGLIILLMARVGNSVVGASSIEDSHNSGISAKQRSLAEISEVIFTSNLIHRGVLNEEEMAVESLATLTMGNKMAVLGGDYLLSNASSALAKIGNVEVTESMAQAIADMSEADFIGTQNDSGKYEVRSMDEWERRIFLGCGSLLARSCLSCITLAGCNEEYKRNAFDFGTNISYAYALSQFLKETKNGGLSETLPDPFYSLPDFSVPSDAVKENMRSYSDSALSNLSVFPSCQARSSLITITEAVKSSDI